MTNGDDGIKMERRLIIIGFFSLTIGMLLMAMYDKSLWQEDTFKTLLTAVVVTGLLGMVAAFYFSANSGDAAKTANTAKAFDAIKAATTGAPSAGGKPDVILEPGETAQAAGGSVGEAEEQEDVRHPVSE